MVTFVGTNKTNTDIDTCSVAMCNTCESPVKCFES